jgi:predicted ATPase
MCPSPRPRLNLIGQDESLERMMSILARAMDGSGGAILISGESGSGKTRLAEEFESLASRSGWLCANAQCEPGQPPYAPLAQALMGLRRVKPALSTDASLEVLRKVLTSSEGDGLAARGDRALFAARDILEAVCREACVLLRLEDLHLCDASTIQGMHFLAREALGRKALLVVTYSDDELYDRESRPHPLIEAVRVMRREGLCHTVELQPLTLTALGEAMRDMLEADLEGRTLSELHRESGGNPQVAVELVREALRTGGMAVRQGRMALAHEGPMAISHPLRAWMSRKLGRLPGMQREMLDCAALCDEPFDADLLSSALGWDRLETMELLDAAMRCHRLYVEQAEGYRFRWPVLRRVASSELGHERTMDLARGIDRAKGGRAGGQGRG